MPRKRFNPKPPKVIPGAAAAADARAAAAASRVANINLQAMTGRADIVQGARVQIRSGLYEGEFAIVESVVGGVIPAAVVRTEAGRTRRVRTVDLVPAPAGSPAPASSTAPQAGPAPATSPAPQAGLEPASETPAPPGPASVSGAARASGALPSSEPDPAA